MRFTLALLLLLPCSLHAQTVKLPDDMIASPGDLIPADVAYDGDDMKLTVSKGLTTFRVYDPDPKKYSFMLYVPPKAEPGKYTMTAAVCKANKLGPMAQCTITVGSPDPGPFDKAKKVYHLRYNDSPTAADDRRFNDLEEAIAEAKRLATVSGKDVAIIDSNYNRIQVVRPAKFKSMSAPCSPACSCGCNEGQPCTCGHSSAAPVQRAVQIAPSGRRGGSC